MPETNKFRRKAKKEIVKVAKGMSAYDVAMKALKGLQFVRGIINAEKKFFDTSVASTYTYNGAVNCLTLVPGGSALSQRNGNSIFVRGLSIRGSILLDTGTSSCVVRMIVFQDLDSDPGTVNPTDVVQTIGTADAPYAPVENVNRRRFKILTTKMVTLSSSGDIMLPFKTWIPLKTHCRWNTSTASDINKGHIYTLILSDRTTFPPTIRYVSRVHYYDN